MGAITFPADTDVHYAGTLSARVMNVPSNAISNSQIIAAAGIEATKIVHQHALSYSQAGGSDVVSATVPVHIFRGAAEIIAVEVVPIVAPTGGDKQFTVDVQLGNAGSAFASILSAVVDVDDAGSTDRTVMAGTITTDDAADGDTLQVVVTASGSTGSQGQGVIVTVWIREQP